MPGGWLQKVLSYRDQGDTSQDAHAAHWADFTWTSGPVIVASVGPWGNMQVWAVSEEEGKRVIRHAASIAGWDPDDTSKGRWIVTSTPHPRYGRVALMRLRVKQGNAMVSKRDGPDGAPFVVL